MSLARRTLLKSVGLATLGAPLAGRAFADPVSFAPIPGAARTFELVTRIEIADARGPTRAWVPATAQDYAGWFKAGETRFSGNAAEAALKSDRRSGAKFVEASWGAGAKPSLEVVSRFSTRDRAVGLAGGGAVESLSEAERARYLAPTRFVPVDGIVKATSDAIVARAGARTDVEKVRALYEWVVDHTYRDPATPGCGACNVKAMLETGRMGGKCADINPLMVGLSRAAGIPARDIFGVRVGPSRFGYKSLGPVTPVVSKAQHCRAEVYLSGIGWFPVDPADVRKVVLEEPPGHLDLSADKVVAARQTLFGAWETNWLPYNSAQDVRLSGSQGEAIPFLMYPQAEVGGQRLDSLNPDAFHYTLTAREIIA